jgi:phage tail-like protein
MTRLLISDVDGGRFGTAVPLRVNVPGLLLDDELFMLLCAALDDLLAPAVVALDCFPAYLDTALAPDDFLPWLAALVGAATPQREAVAGATASYGERGTAAGIRAVAARAAGVPLDAVAVNDPGGVTWSSTPGSATAAAPRRARIRVDAPGADPDPVHAAVEAARPVHCPIDVEVVST